MRNQNDRLQQILDIGIALSRERNADKLFDYIVDTAMSLTNSDGGTLYVVKDDTLNFRIMKTKSKGVDLGSNGEEINIPPVQMSKENICAYAAISKKSLNIKNVYESNLFDFSGPKKYDEMNGYHTQSMVAIPMIDHDDEVIGVMQLINAMDDSGNIRPYSDEEERILLSLASQTAIAISNMLYIEEINKQIWSFTEALTEAIDARTPYNGSHTRKVAEYAGKIADYINLMHEEGKEDTYFTAEHKDQLVMAAYLHDIGKMIVPIEVMNKQTRLGRHLEKIDAKLEIINLHLDLDYAKKEIALEEYNAKKELFSHAKEVIHTADAAGFLTDDLYEQVKEIVSLSYKNKDNTVVIPLFTEEEKTCIQVRKGTLTDEERKIMESHVVMTERILSKVHFNKKYIDAPKWAAEHHECINGTGYPGHLSGEKLGIESRILAVADICDALLATDRPYKKPMPKEKAFEILKNMAKEGKIEEKYVEYLEKCI